MGAIQILYILKSRTSILHSCIYFIYFTQRFLYNIGHKRKSISIQNKNTSRKAKE